MKEKKLKLIKLLVASGLLTYTNASTEVNQLKDQDIDKMVKILEMDNVEPAIRVTAATGPAGGKKHQPDNPDLPSDDNKKV